MKTLLKLSFSALAIAVCLTNCTKDNSVKPSAKGTVNASSGLSARQSVLAHRDTITPGPGGGAGSKLITPLVSRDTITPGPGGGGKGGSSSKLFTPSVSRDTITPGPNGGAGGGKG